MAEKKTGRLGTGLGVLFGEKEDPLEQGSVQTLPLSRVEPRKDQPRRDFDESALQTLADSIREAGTKAERIIATGGGAKSAVWCQMQADLTGLPVVVPKDSEAACLGAAIAAAVTQGAYPSLEAACSAAVSMDRSYTPRTIPEQKKRYRQFCAIFEATRGIAKKE